MSRMVLIADGNTTRGKRLAAACQRAGVECRTGPHGAAALELALSEQPGLVVAQLDLPLVDAVKLAEILRANPRTQRSRFLFLGESGPERRRLGRPGDRLLPAGSHTEQIVQVIEELIARQDRLDEVDRAAQSGRKVEGELALVSLADLLGLFQTSRASGRLVLERGDGREAGPREHGQLWLRDGEVLQAETARASNEKALFRLLAWRTGCFSFEPRDVDEPAFIATSTRILLQEGLRQIEEWDRLSTNLPPLDSEVRVRVKTADLPNIVHPLTQEVMLLLELYSSVREVVDHCSFPDYQVLRTLHTLAEREIVELGRVPLPPPTGGGRGAEGLFNDAQLRRLREWIEAGAAPQGHLLPAKLVVAASDPAAVPDFANLFRAVPGAALTLDMAHGKLGPDDLAPIGRLELEPGVAIELIHVPRSDRFSALWSMAGHRALGTLFLLDGAVGDAADRLAPMCETLGQLSRARTFHVVLLRKRGRISPDELRENLSLIDEASLFLLPLESEKEPASLLRGLFARVVP